MFESSLSKSQNFFINFNANKVRWLADSKISPSNVFCVGSGENVVFCLKDIIFKCLINVIKKIRLEKDNFMEDGFERWRT